MRSSLQTPMPLMVVLVLLLSGLSVSAQEFLMSDGMINTCSGFFLDSGGNTTFYSPNEDYTFTICPDGSSGTHIQLIFPGTDIQAGDVIEFYDGTTVDPATQFAAEFEPGAPFIIQATAVNPSGCVTIHFTSDATGNGTGWSAQINCITACQLIQAQLVSTDPPVMPADTGYIDVCPGDRISLSGMGIYPQNGAVYEHSDFTSSFEWDFGDGTSAVGPNVTKVYDEPGGYIIQLTITDERGCTNTNFISQRVRVSPPPSFIAGGQLDDEICAGDTVTLNAVVNTSDPSTLVSVIPNEGSFQAGGVRSDSLPLPDGTGAVYETSIAFTDFSPGQILTDINDLLSICVVMEHSWLFDLDVFISCPDGTTVILQDQQFIANEVFLGIPNESDDIGTPNPPAQGIGWEYCWVPNAPNGTWTEYVQANDPPTLPSGNYDAFEDLNNLVGCPLNGEWTIIVQDQWGSDNGWIFEWSINFDPSIFPDIEKFTPPIIDYQWENNPSIFYYSQDSIAAAPQNAGMANYIFTVTNDFGCVYDTSINFSVLPFTHPDCYSCAENLTPVPDTVVCEGESVTLDASATIPTETSVTFESFPYYPFGFFNHPPANPYMAPINVNSINPLTLTDPATQIESVCIDIATDWDADLNIFLRAPNGVQIALSTGNGGGFDNYTNTCFSPTAAIPITSGTAPFTGTFLPEGNFNAFIGSNINGNWSIVVSDAFGINDIGEFISWSITFVSTNEVTYDWTPTNGLTCTDCPTTVATPLASTEYIINSLDSYGCAYSDSVFVGVVGDIAAPEVVCRITADGVLTFSWEQVSTFQNYEVNVTLNGSSSGWFGPINALEYDVTGLQPDDEVMVEVRVFVGGNPANCPLETGSAFCIYDVCEMEASIVSTTDISCFGADDGMVEVTAIDGDEPYSYFIDGNSVANPNGIFGALGPGDHYILVEDSDNCQDSIAFSIAEPDELIAFAEEASPVNCFNATDGMLVATATGGSGTYEFIWSADPGNPSPNVPDVGAGTYTVTVTDSQNCTAETSITITQPDSLEVTLTPTDALCAGATDGNIVVEVIGGTGNYTYLWSDNSTGNDLQNIGAGDYCLTVTDANGCETIACTTLDAPETIMIDALSSTPVRCFGGNTGTATVNPSGGSGTYTYIWDDPLGQFTQTATSLPAGQYGVTVTDENGCTVSGQIEVLESDLITIEPTLVDVACFDEATGSISIAVEGGETPYDFNWSNNATTNVLENLTAGIYSLTLTDANDCLMELDYTIEQPNMPLEVEVQQSYEGCYGEATAEATATASGGTGMYDFSWSDGQSGFVAMGLDTLEVTVTVIDENGCEAQTSIIPSDFDPIMANVIPVFPSCFGYSDGRLGINNIQGGAGILPEDYDYNWNNGQDGLIADNLSGDRSYVVTITDIIGCQTVVSTFLPQPDPITYETDSTDVLCFAGSDGTATIFNIQGSNPGYTVSWGNSANNQVGATATGLATGTYTATITDAQNCMESATVTVLQPTALEIQLSGQNNQCFGDSEGQIATAVNGGVGGYSYSWSTGADISKIAGLPSGVYQVTLTDANGCQLVASTELIDPEPVMAVLTPQDVSCNGSRDGRIQVAVEGGTPPYRYSLDNKTFNGASNIVGLVAGQYDVFVQDAFGCMFTERVFIEEPPTFVVDAGDDQTLVLGDSIQLAADAVNDRGEVTYVWSAPYFGTLSCNECPDPWVVTQNTITYELYGIDSLGCEATDRITIFIQKPRVVAVPTGFTPNGDNINDRLIVHGQEGTRILSFQIFDRWGELLYETGDFEVNNEVFGWDGSFRGEMVNSGVYIWYVEAEYIDGARELFRGQTTVIR